MNYGKHSASHGKRAVAGKHSVPHRHRLKGSQVAATGIALAIAAACVPAGISMAQPAQQGATAAQVIQMEEHPESEEMTPQEKAAIDRILQKRALSAGEMAVRIAREFLGTPYVWGGASPSGFDCSGLTQYVYGKLGVGLDHYAQTQYGQGKQVAKGSLEKGDLVFFGSGTGSIDHVGIYVGHGKYLHAPKTGDVVKVSELAERGDYVGACRPA